jgi:hypothetical protein
MADTILELMTRVNVEPLKSAMTDAAGSVSSSTQKMKADIASFSSSSMAANQGVEATMAGLPKEFIKVEAGGVFAFEQIKRRVIEATSEVGALRQEILGTNDAAKLDQLNAQLDQARARMTAARTEMRAMRMETTETREKADLLADSMGVRIPGALGKLTGQIPAVQGLMNALFAPTLALFFAEAVNNVAVKIGDMARQMGGFGEAERKAYESALEYNSRLILQSLELKEKMQAVSVIGKEGAAKYAIEARNAAAAAKEEAVELERVKKNMEEQEKVVKRLSDRKNLPFASGEQIKITGEGIEAYNLEEEFNKAEASLKRMQQTYNELDTKLRERPVKTGERGAEEAARQGEEARSVQRANVDAQKSLQDEYVNYYVQGLRRMYADEKITLEDEVAGEKAAIQAHLENERTWAAQRKAILAAEHQATGKDVGKDVAGVNEKLITEELKARSEIAAINQKYNQDKLQQTNAVNLATVEAAKKSGDAEIQVVEETAKRRFASGEIMLAELTAIEKAASNQRIDGRRSELQELLRQANEYPEKYKDKIITLNGQLLDLERERTVQSDAIDAESANRKRQVLSIEAEAAKEHQQSLLDIERLGIETRASLGLISGRERVSQLQAITAQEFALEREEIEKKKALYAEGTAQYEQAEKELQAITDRQSKQMAQDEANALKERFAQWHKFTSQVESDFSNSVGQMIRGQKTFGQAMAELWGNMVVQWAQTLARMMVQFITHEAAKLILHQVTEAKSTTATIAANNVETISVITGQAQQATAVAAGQAAQTAAATTGSTTRTSVSLLEDIKSIGRAAATAAAHAFKWVMEEVPFPANIALAPAVAAAAFAGVLAFGTMASAAGGMDVKADQLALIHKNEMVLPESIAQNFRGPFMSGSASGLTPGLAMSAASAMTSGANAIQGSMAALAFGASGPSDLSASMAALHSGASGSTSAGAGGGNSSGDRAGSGGDTNYRTMHNHIRVEMHDHGNGKGMSQEDIVNAVKRGVKSGHLRLENS